MQVNDQVIQERDQRANGGQTRKGVSRWWVAFAFLIGWNLAFTVRDHFDKPLIQAYKKSLDECQSLLESHDSKSVITIDEIKKRKRIII